MDNKADSTKEKNIFLFCNKARLLLSIVLSIFSEFCAQSRRATVYIIKTAAIPDKIISCEQ